MRTQKLRKRKEALELTRAHFFKLRSDEISYRTRSHESAAELVLVAGPVAAVLELAAEPAPVFVVAAVLELVAAVLELAVELVAVELVAAGLLAGLAVVAAGLVAVVPVAAPASAEPAKPVGPRVLLHAYAPKPSTRGYAIPQPPQALQHD